MWDVFVRALSCLSDEWERYISRLFIDENGEKSLNENAA